MSPHAALAAAAEVTAGPSLAALRQLLDDLSSVVMTMDEAVYSARPFPQVSGSVGEHVRHCLDHISALIASGSGEFLSYDHRDRGTAIERNPNDALRQMLRLKDALDRSLRRSLDEPLCVRTKVSCPGGELISWSSFGRELAFVLSHTIHHQALIAVLLAVQGVDVEDERFGLAPSTPTRKS